MKWSVHTTATRNSLILDTLQLLFPTIIFILITSLLQNGHVRKKSPCWVLTSYSPIILSVLTTCCGNPLSNEDPLALIPRGEASNLEEAFSGAHLSITSLGRIQKQDGPN